MKIFIKKRTLFLIVLCLIIGSFALYKFYDSSNSHPWTISKTQDNSKRFISKETIVKSIKQKQKLITTEVNMNETIAIDNSWGDLAVFKKVQDIDFVGTGIYTIDLSKLSSNNIDIKNNIIKVSIPKPSVESITLDENKTVYNKTDRGLLRFGEIKLSTEDHDQLLKTVKEKMNDKMLEKPYYDTAINNSKKSMISLLNSIIGGTKNTYEIQINFY
ncbi:MAG: DUF4230 domain-containing protein [Clostridium sp.]|nr:DUF4230 domain-containing protein [Clostridium sp.]